MGRDLANKRRWYHENKHKYAENHRTYNLRRYYEKKDEINKKAAARYQATKEQIRWQNLWSAYRITKEQYFALLERQNNSCAVCKVSQDVLTYPLHVDHCHKSKVIRGLLCANCNFGIGSLKDNIGYLNNAVVYLSQRDL